MPASEKARVQVSACRRHCCRGRRLAWRLSTLSRLTKRGMYGHMRRPCMPRIDIDGFDPSIAPGTGTPSHGGFLYYEVLEIIQALAKRSQGKIVGMDLVEVAPAYDPAGVTSILAAQLLLNSID